MPVDPPANDDKSRRRKKKKADGVLVDPPIEDCPVVPMGYEGDQMVLALPGGELRFVTAGRVQNLLRTDLFVDPAGQAFANNWIDGEGDFKALSMAIWFNQKCREAGKWNRMRLFRGPGVWATPDGPVLHAGDALGRWPFKEADWTPIAQAMRTRTRGPIYTLAPPTPRPVKAASIADAQKLRDHLDQWNWYELAEGGLTGADVALAWQGSALLGAVPHFRPHILCIGGRGTGKTALSMLMAAVGSANGGELEDRFTEAGMRGEISGEARARYLDEAEPSIGGQGPVEQAMEMLRRMTTGDGSKGVMIGKDGKPVNQTAVGAAWLGAILSVELSDAMDSRMVEVRLKPLGKAKGGADDTLREYREWAEKTSPAFLARAMRDHARYRSDVSLMKDALGRSGADARGADLIAALAAGRRLLLKDEALTEGSVGAELALWTPLIVSREETSTALNVGQGCFSAIMNLVTKQHIRDRFWNVGEMVQEECESRGTHDKVLKTFGILIENNPPGADHPGPWLIVANRHPALKAGLAPTEYKNWRSALQHLGDLGEEFRPRTLPYAPKFGVGQQSRALAIPLTPWLVRPAGVGVTVEASPFEPPKWHMRAAASRDSSPSSYPGESHE
ncbi:hypothetical protein KOAAANKH_00111 [Brevundimonas sp. NIBR10]|uniref:hypothetical protein n=1 Tax=Brevundimonas sp. NIBR10 TaxID=3015997 RepID=UPI0022F176A6|nr:hypothetical protein [Brevundimonas sp. NIBR10]WGM45250.1 hypothetical protein KOAAANKH_00111 [Brevundimonas sp. NIBR10]